MTLYRITNRHSGADRGVWQADSPEDALRLLLDEAGAQDAAEDLEAREVAVEIRETTTDTGARVSDRRIDTGRPSFGFAVFRDTALEATGRGAGDHVGAPLDVGGARESHATTWGSGGFPHSLFVRGDARTGGRIPR